MPSPTAKSCSATFHKRERLPLLPPPSAVISSSCALLYRLDPIFVHQRWIALRGKARRVVIDADANPTLVPTQVIDAVRNRFAQILIQKVVYLDLLRFAHGLPFTPAILERAD